MQRDRERNNATKSPTNSYQVINSGSSIYSTSKGGPRWTDSPRIKTPQRASWEGVQVREFREPSLSFSESVRNGYLASPHAHITTPSSRQPKNHLRTVTATVQADFVCVEKVHAEAHLSTGGMGILWGGEMRRERERERGER